MAAERARGRFGLKWPNQQVIPAHALMAIAFRQSALTQIASEKRNSPKQKYPPTTTRRVDARSDWPRFRIAIAIGSPDPAQETTDAAAGVHCRLALF